MPSVGMHGMHGSRVAVGQTQGVCFSDWGTYLPTYSGGTKVFEPPWELSSPVCPNYHYFDAAFKKRVLDSILDLMIPLHSFAYNPLNMARGKELSPQMRSHICELHLIGWGAKRIHSLYQDLPLGTIKYTIYKESARKDNKSLPRSGAPRKISEEEQDHIYDLSIHDPHIKIRELQDEVSTPITKQTIRRLLREMHKKWLQKVRPELKEEHAN
jgi:hypothetical protein